MQVFTSIFPHLFMLFSYRQDIVVADLFPTEVLKKLLWVKQNISAELFGVNYLKV